MQKQANAPRAAKPAKQAAPAKPETAKAAKPAKPTQAEREAAQAAKQAARESGLADVRAARKLAADTVAAYYNGASLPFKAAADRFADLRTDKAAKRPSQRQAALLASMLLAGDNIKPDGTFTRGGFTLDGKRVQPETGCLSDMLGRAVHYVSGPLSGRGQIDTVLRVDLETAKTEITGQIGGALAKQALERIAALQAAA